MTSALPPILVVEDNPEDYTALSRAFRKHRLLNPIVRGADGDEALEYLQSYGQHPKWPSTMPAFVLLDLNMPGTDGRAVLDTLKRDPKLCQIPVIIFSTSANSRDIEDCYRMGANSYVTKPIEYPVLEEKINLIMRYWLQETHLPAAA